MSDRYYIVLTAAALNAQSIPNWIACRFACYCILATVVLTQSAELLRSHNGLKGRHGIDVLTSLVFFRTNTVPVRVAPAFFKSTARQINSHTGNSCCLRTELLNQSQPFLNFVGILLLPSRKFGLYFSQLLGCYFAL